MKSLKKQFNTFYESYHRIEKTHSEFIKTTFDQTIETITNSKLEIEEILNSLKNLENKNNYENIIENSKKIKEHIKTIENKLNNCILDIIIDKYMDIENLTLDNVYDTGKHLEEFKNIAKIFLGDNDNALNEYCEKRNEKKLEEDIEKLKKEGYTIKEIEDSEGKKCFEIKKGEEEYMVTKQNGKSLIYCIENEIKKNLEKGTVVVRFQKNEKLNSLLKDIKSILKSQQIERMTR